MTDKLTNEELAAIVRKAMNDAATGIAFQIALMLAGAGGLIWILWRYVVTS
jgi:hypothetical protein